MGLIFFGLGFFQGCGDPKMEDMRQDDSLAVSGKQAFFVDLESDELNLVDARLTVVHVNGEFAGDKCQDGKWQIKGSSGVVYASPACTLVYKDIVLKEQDSSELYTLSYNDSASFAKAKDGREIRFSKGPDNQPLVYSNFSKSFTKSVVLNIGTSQGVSVRIDDSGLAVCNSSDPIRFTISPNQKQFVMAFNPPAAGFPQLSTLSAPAAPAGNPNFKMDEVTKSFVFNYTGLGTGTFFYPGPFAISVGKNSCSASGISVTLNADQVAAPLPSDLIGGSIYYSTLGKNALVQPSNDTNLSATSWAVPNLPAGNYQVSVTWDVPPTPAASFVKYEVFVNSVSKTSKFLSQVSAPKDFLRAEGRSFEFLALLDLPEATNQVVVKIYPSSNGKVSVAGLHIIKSELSCAIYISPLDDRLNGYLYTQYDYPPLTAINKGSTALETLRECYGRFGAIQNKCSSQKFYLAYRLPKFRLLQDGTMPKTDFSQEFVNSGIGRGVDLCAVADRPQIPGSPVDESPILTPDGNPTQTGPADESPILIPGGKPIQNFPPNQEPKPVLPKILGNTLGQTYGEAFGIILSVSQPVEQQGVAFQYVVIGDVAPFQTAAAVPTSIKAYRIISSNQTEYSVSEGEADNIKIGDVAYFETLTDGLLRSFSAAPKITIKSPTKYRLEKADVTTLPSLGLPIPTPNSIYLEWVRNPGSVKSTVYAFGARRSFGDFTKVPITFDSSDLDEDQILSIFDYDAAGKLNGLGYHKFRFVGPLVP